MKHIPLKFIKEDPAVGNADSSDDARESTGMLERLVADVRGQLAGLSPAAEPLRRADLLLQHVVDETPPEADGAAVAAITAHYLADLRAREPQRENLPDYAGQVFATVARRHSGVAGQEDFNRWIEDMELNNPALFLPRLRNVVDVLVQDEWWFDRDALQAALPAD